MKYIILFTLIILQSLATQAEASSSKSGEAVLSAKAKKALKKFDRNFKVFKLSHYDERISMANRNSPFMIKHDLNSDRKNDIMLMGYNIKQRKVLFLGLLSQPNGSYKVYVFKKKRLTRDDFSKNKSYVSKSIREDFNGTPGTVIVVEEIQALSSPRGAPVFMGPLTFYYSKRQDKITPLLMSFND